MKWTPEENVTLCELFEQGLTYSDISARMGRSKSAVADHAHRMGLRREPRVALTDGYAKRRHLRVRKASAVHILKPNARGYFDSRAALHRLIEAWR